MLQGRLSPEHKLAPELQSLLDGDADTLEFEDVRLAVSFPLLHYGDSEEEGRQGLGAAYDPASAAVAEWPQALQGLGIGTEIRRTDSHAVTVSAPPSKLSVSPHAFQDVDV